MANIQIKLQIKCWAYLLLIHSCDSSLILVWEDLVFNQSKFLLLMNWGIIQFWNGYFPSFPQNLNLEAAAITRHSQTNIDSKNPDSATFWNNIEHLKRLKWNRVLPFSAVKETICLTNANYKFHLKNPMKKARLGLWSWDGSRDVMDGVNCHKSPIHPILTLAVRGRIGENYRCLPLVRVARIFCISSPSSSSECVLRLYLTFDINP